MLGAHVKKGLGLLSGSLPEGSVNPGAHHFVHDGRYTGTHCLLPILWMMGFERFVTWCDVWVWYIISHTHSHSPYIHYRFNKWLKGLLRVAQHAVTALANAVAIDIAAAYVKMCLEGFKYDVKTAFHHICVLAQKRGAQTLFSPREMGDMRMCGIAVDPLELECFAVAYIMGVHFHAGQWGRSTCSSVITCVINGRSLYGRVCKFFTVDGSSCPGYASVVWFGEPQYPLGANNNRLEVVVSDDGTAISGEVGCIVRITQIDPSPVVVEPDGRNYRMMRQSGYDTIVT